MADLASTPFGHAAMYWVGMRLTDATAQDVEAFNRHYNEVHAPEVLALDPGPVEVHRYRLLADESEGDAVPEWLCVYEFADEESAAGYLGRQWGPPEGRPRFTPGPPVWTERKETVWRVLWHRVATRGRAEDPPEQLRMVGMDPAPDHTDDELDAFNAHYDDVHLLEAMESVPYASASRYRLGDAFRPQPASTPEYCAVYQAGPRELAAVRAAQGVRNVRPPDDTHPRAWRERNTAWRLSWARVPME